MDEIHLEGQEGFARKILNLEYKIRLPELLLQRLDYATMAHSIEARAPFLGIRLIESILPTSFEERNKNRIAKAWIRDAATRHLPPYILNFPKSGFGAEFMAMLNAQLGDRFEQEIILRPDAPIRTFLKDDFFKLCLSRHKRRGNYAPRLWIVYTLNRWLAKHL